VVRATDIPERNGYVSGWIAGHSEQRRTEVPDHSDIGVPYHQLERYSISDFKPVELLVEQPCEYPSLRSNLLVSLVTLSAALSTRWRLYKNIKQSIQLNIRLIKLHV